MMYKDGRNSHTYASLVSVGLQETELFLVLFRAKYSAVKERMLSWKFLVAYFSSHAGSAKNAVTTYPDSFASRTAGKTRVGMKTV